MSINIQGDDSLNKLNNNNLLSRLASVFGDSQPKHYLPLRQNIPTELDSYKGKYSNQPDFLYFKNMMATEHYS